MIFYVYMTFKKTKYSQRPCYKRQKYTFGTLSAALKENRIRIEEPFFSHAKYLKSKVSWEVIQNKYLFDWFWTSTPSCSTWKVHFYSVFAVFKDSLSLVSLSYNVSEWDQM